MTFKPGDAVVHTVKNHSWNRRTQNRKERCNEFKGVIQRVTEKVAFVLFDGKTIKPCAFESLRHA